MQRTRTPPHSLTRQKIFVQEVTGTFLYYARAINTTMLTALGSITKQQANPRENTIQKVKQFLDNATTFTDAIVS